MTIRIQGEWLFAEAATTGDWHSAAIALRQDVARLGEEKAALVRALEDAWTVGLPAAVEPAITVELLEGGLLEFTAEAVRP